MKRYAAPMNAQLGVFEVHAEGCRDLSNPRKRRDMKLLPGEVPEVVEAESAEAAGKLMLAEDFSGTDGIEHPARDGYPGGSFGAAGFGYKVLPCARR